MSGPPPGGLLLVDKPAGWTSHDVVAKVRGLASTRRVGHAGTLDPMATGVLVLGIDRATRLLTYLVGADKTYTATVRLGVATITDDAEGEATAVTSAAVVDEAAVRREVARLTGPVQQVPSAVSAIKVDGKRSYARVRAGEDVQLAARPVTVHRFEVLTLRPAAHQDVPVLDVDVEVECSSGTYVRALARDLGAALGVGGHLTALRRTRVGGYGLDRCRTLDELVAAGPPVPLLASADAARAAFRVRELTEQEAQALSHGKRLAAQGPDEGRSDGARDGRTDPDAPVAAIAPDGTLVALLTERAGTARPLVVLAPAG